MPPTKYRRGESNPYAQRTPAPKADAATITPLRQVAGRGGTLFAQNPTTGTTTIGRSYYLFIYTLCGDVKGRRILPSGSLRNHLSGFDLSLNHHLQ